MVKSQGRQWRHRCRPVFLCVALVIATSLQSSSCADYLRGTSEGGGDDVERFLQAAASTMLTTSSLATTMPTSTSTFTTTVATPITTTSTTTSTTTVTIVTTVTSVTATTSTYTKTETTTETTTPVAAIAASSDDSTTIILIAAIIGGLLCFIGILFGGGAAIAHWKKANEMKHFKEGELDGHAMEFEAKKQKVGTDVQIYLSKYEEVGASKNQNILPVHLQFLEDWKAFDALAQSFLNDWRVGYNARRGIQPAGSLVSAAGAHQVSESTGDKLDATPNSGRTEAGIIAGPVGISTGVAPTQLGTSAGAAAGRTGAEAAATTAATKKGTPNPKAPGQRKAATATSTSARQQKVVCPPIAEVKVQLAGLQALEDRLRRLVPELRNLVLQVSPDLVLTDEDQPAGNRHDDNDRTTGNHDRGHGHGHGHGGGGYRWEEQVEFLHSLRHPLANKIKIVPYGVLGSAQGQSDPAPGSKIQAVIVDPAGYPYIGFSNNPGGAGGAAGSVYQWLQIERSTFPEVVHNHFRIARSEEEAETMAFFHKYNDGQYVIHAVGPKIDKLLEGVTDLAQVYTNILSEYCLALRKEDLKVPKVLRLLPVSSGIFLQNKRLDRHMPQMTAAALSVAFARLPLSMHDMLKSVDMEMCVFLGREQGPYKEVFPGWKVNASGASGPATATPPAAGTATGTAAGAAAAAAAAPPGPLQLAATRGCVSDHFGEFSWVRSKNGPKERLERLGAMLLTQNAIFCGGYQLAGTLKPVLLDTKKLQQGTRVLRAPQKPPRPSSRGSKRASSTTIVWEEFGTVMEVAIQASTGNKKVVAVNAASAFHVGGGVLSGGRHALEETWCTISTLLPSLLEISWEEKFKARQHSQLIINGSTKSVNTINGSANPPSSNMPSSQAQSTPIGASQVAPAVASPRGVENVTGGALGEPHVAHMHIPVDGCIVSPDVMIFRDVSSKGYVFHDRVVRLAGVCSVAMFNMNYRVSDSPVDAPRDFGEYCRLVKFKFRSLVAGAKQLDADILVCPDIGCGVFENDPHVLGTILGEVLLENSGSFSQVILTGKAQFAEAARSVFAGVREKLIRPSFFTSGEAEIAENDKDLVPPNGSSKSAQSASSMANSNNPTTPAGAGAGVGGGSASSSGGSPSSPTKKSAAGFCCGRGAAQLGSEPTTTSGTSGKKGTPASSTSKAPGVPPAATAKAAQAPWAKTAGDANLEQQPLATYGVTMASGGQPGGSPPASSTVTTGNPTSAADTPTATAASVATVPKASSYGAPSQQGITPPVNSVATSVPASSQPGSNTGSPAPTPVTVRAT